MYISIYSFLHLVDGLRVLVDWGSRFRTKTQRFENVPNFSVFIQIPLSFYMFFKAVFSQLGHARDNGVCLTPVWHGLGGRVIWFWYFIDTFWYFLILFWSFRGTFGKPFGAPPIFPYIMILFFDVVIQPRLPRDTLLGRWFSMTLPRDTSKCMRFFFDTTCRYSFCTYILLFRLFWYIFDTFLKHFFFSYVC